MKKSFLFLLGTMSLVIVFIASFFSTVSAQSQFAGKWEVFETQDMGKNQGESVGLFAGWVKGTNITFTSDSLIVGAPLGNRQYSYRRSGQQLLVKPNQTRVLGVEIDRSERKQNETNRIPFTFEGGKLILGSDAMGKRIVLIQASK